MPIIKYTLVIGTLLCFVDNSLSKIANNEQAWSQWSWSCEKDECVRKMGAAGDDLTQGSSEACRLVCGQYGGLWPIPTIFTSLSKQVIPFHPSSISFEMNDDLSTATQEFMVKMFDIFRGNIQRECKTNCTILSDAMIEIRLKIASDDLTLTWDTDEAYTLNLSTKGNIVSIQINSETIFGARHGLETLSQLIVSYSATKTTAGLIIISEAQIQDKPVYPHRGHMIDTARNFIPIYLIRRTIDGMSANKMNVLHWHATDTQSFPLESSRVPQLSRFGAYSLNKVYSTTNVEDLLHYARVRGIRIIMEIDAPAHAGAGWQWGHAAGLGDLVACWQHQPWREQCIQPPCGQLNPANPHLYRVLGDLFKDIVEQFPREEVFHMGGDEVFFACWNATKQITDLLDSRGMGREESDFIKLWAEYQATALRIYDEAAGLENSSRTPPDLKTKPSPIILWTSHLTEPKHIEQYLDKDRYVIQAWVIKSSPLPDELLELGYKLIYSTKDAWYLDHGFWGITVYHPWREVYDNLIPTNKLVLGGETCMWSEYVDENNYEARVWPRTAAAAERLWSNPKTNAKMAESRFTRQRQRLITRGIKPEAIQPMWCYQNGGKCA